MFTCINSLMIELSLCVVVGLICTLIPTSVALAFQKSSLDQIDKLEFKPGSSPMDGTPVLIALQPGKTTHADGPVTVLLDGVWEMAEGGQESERLLGEWHDAIPARVPGSVHAALLNAELIPDPYVGFNDIVAKEQSFKTWWFKRTFDCPQGMPGEMLLFGGVAVSCTVWLNGEKLGSHNGMFGGPDFDVSCKLVHGSNTLVVRIDPAPHRISRGEPNSFFTGMNVGWLDTVVFNNVYGWHYIDLPALGIWRSVVLKESPVVEIADPFIATKDAHKGIVSLSTTLRSKLEKWSGRLVGTIEPSNFVGDAYSFSYEVSSNSGAKEILLEFAIPDPKLWWPVDLGEPNLYELHLSFIDDDAGDTDYKTVTFGVRTIEMQPLPGGAQPQLYNWTFVINGKPVFVKGSNWCTIDALMRFDKERYDRFLTLAQNQHIQILRAWGGGMPETNEFYDLANRKGIMVIQEWPTAWDSHEVQPYDILEETIIRNTLRLRNNPSLVMWGAGNESGDPRGSAITMMGRLAYELDGTRPFHRGEPWGGSLHNYDVYWGSQPLDRNLSLTAPFIGEFGIASVPNYETVEKYLPDDEKNIWPIPATGSFAHRTPVFNKKDDMRLLEQYVSDFVQNDSIQNFVLGSQLAQATGMRHTLELARTRWPDTTGVCYYKLTDNNPAASWASVDWHGVPKLAYYIFQDAYAPLHAAVLFDSLTPAGKHLSLPVYLLDDADYLDAIDWKVVVRAYDSRLHEIKRQVFTGFGSIGCVLHVGYFDLTEEQTGSIPLLIVSEVITDGNIRDRTFYWTNYKLMQGSLFALPRTSLDVSKTDGYFVIMNTGNTPAVGVHFECPSVSDVFVCEDNYFWLDPGEQRSIAVNETQGVNVKAWNSGWYDGTPPDPPKNVQISTVDHNKINLCWDAVEDSEIGIYGYRIYRDGEEIAMLSPQDTIYTDTELAEDTKYTYWIVAVNRVGMESNQSQHVSATTAIDVIPPAVVAVLASKTEVVVLYDEEVDRKGAENLQNYSIDGDIDLEAAVLGKDGKTLSLKVSELAPDVLYTLTIRNIKDVAKFPNTLEFATTSFVANIIACWSFDDGNGVVAHDLVDSRNNAILNGAVWVEDQVKGIVLGFDGIDDYVEVGNKDINLGARFTIMCWVKVARGSRGFRVFLAKGAKTQGHYEMYVDPAGEFRVYFPELEEMGSTNLRGDIGSGARIDDGLWHHVALTCDGRLMTFFVDGRAVKVCRVSGMVSDTTNTLAFGKLLDEPEYPLPFAGALGEIRIYTRALDKDEIERLVDLETR